MINHIQVTGVTVSDQDKAKEFYTETLGMALRIDQQMGPDFRWLEVAPENGQASISLAAPMGDSTPGGMTGLIFDTSDVKGAYETLKAKGVNFIEEPTEQAWGAIQAIFSDPDGNIFSLVQRLS